MLIAHAARGLRRKPAARLSAPNLVVSGESGQKALTNICCAVFPKLVGYVCQAVQVTVFKFSWQVAVCEGLASNSLLVWLHQRFSWQASE